MYFNLQELKNVFDVGEKGMKKIFKFLLHKVNATERVLFIECIGYSFTVALFPLLWTLLPEMVTNQASAGNIKGIFFYALVLGGGASLALLVSTFLYNNAWMRMNHVRYSILQELIHYSLQISYEITHKDAYLKRLEQTKRATMSPEVGVGAVLKNIFVIWGSVITTIGLWSIISRLSWVFVLLVSASILISFFLSFVQQRAERKEWEENSNYIRRAEKMADYATDEQYGSDLRIFSLQKVVHHYLRLNFTKIIEEKEQTDHKTHHLQVGIYAIEFVQNIGVYGWIAYQVLQKNIGIGSFLTYTIGVQQLGICIQEFLRQWNTIRNESRKFKGFFELKEMSDGQINEIEEEINSSQDSLGKSESTGCEIEFRNITFSYPGQSKPVFCDFNLVIKAGERVALVGKNGTGKSTLLHLLCRLYQPQKGSILINSQDILEMRLNEYYKQIRVVFQDGCLFPFQVKDNIILSNEINEKKYKQAIRDSLFEPVVERLPHQGDTYLSHIMSTDGVDLSGGERQELLLARALYKEAPILLLDEPSGAMDAIAEEKIYQEYKHLSEGSTCIIVSHQLSFIRFCDRILVLESGVIIEQGTHDALIDVGGTYANMYRQQAKAYE